MWLAHVIWQGGRWHSLLMWMCVVTCCDYVWHKEWPMSTFLVWQYYCHRHCCVCGRCYSHYNGWYYHQLEWCDWHMLFDRVAHGIAYPCGCVLWDVVTVLHRKWPMSTFFYAGFHYGLLHTTSSHMWSRLYLPMFLFWNRLFTPIWRAFVFGCNQVMVLPPYYIEVINIDFMMWSGGIIIYRKVSLLMFPEPFSICPCSFPNILFIALHPIRSVLIYDSIFFHNIIFVLGSH